MHMVLIYFEDLFIYLKGESDKEGGGYREKDKDWQGEWEDREKEIFHPLFHSANDHNPDQARSQEVHPGLPYEQQEPKHFRPPSTAFPESVTVSHFGNEAVAF